MTIAEAKQKLIDLAQSQVGYREGPNNYKQKVSVFQRRIESDLRGVLQKHRYSMTACGGRVTKAKREEMKTVITREELEEFIEDMIGGEKT